MVVRTAEYPGVGSSLAARGNGCLIPACETVVRRVVTVVAHLVRLDRGEAAALVRKAVSP